jgi:hypothetical protein
MGENVTDRPWHVVSVLEGKENFHSGHDTKESADFCAADINKRAIALGIISRYSVKQNIPA